MGPPTREQSMRRNEDVFYEEDEDVHSQSSTTTVEHHSDSEDHNEEKEIRNASFEETFHVTLWRYIVIALIQVAGVSLALTLFVFTHNNEEDRFEESFLKEARRIHEDGVAGISAFVSAFQRVGYTMASTALSMNTTFPLSSLAYFENYAASIIETGILSVAVANLVRETEREKFLEFAGENYQSFFQESLRILDDRGVEHSSFFEETRYNPFISKWVGGNFEPDDLDVIYFPTLAFSPIPRSYDPINFNLWSDRSFAQALNGYPLFLELSGEPKKESLTGMEPVIHPAFNSQGVFPVDNDWFTYMVSPVHENPNDRTSRLVSVLVGAFSWKNFINKALNGTSYVDIIVTNTCNQTYTFSSRGNTLLVVAGDQHDSTYDRLRLTYELTPATDVYNCGYSFDIYPTDEFRNPFLTNSPEIIRTIIALIFAAVAAAFLGFDHFVSKRNKRMIERAAHSNAIVTSLFPKNIRDKLIGEEAQKKINKDTRLEIATSLATGTGDDEVVINTEVLADLFLETSVMFADIVGFTAWASIREPTQVFTLLETLYGAYDAIAKSRRVLKIETVGDCYVAATGIPNPQRNHAVLLCRFARDILRKTQVLVQTLEKSFGPDTSDLTLRIGINSGPVTGGLLRGDKARFQLFGDAMNTVSRIETSGAPGKIHLSQDTADLLFSSGKKHWLEKRDEKVSLKGKGLLQTYWLKLSALTMEDQQSTTSDSNSNTFHVTESIQNLPVNPPRATEVDKIKRLVDWNVETLMRVIRRIVVYRRATKGEGACVPKELEDRVMRNNKNFFGEVKEVIPIPHHDSVTVSAMGDIKNANVDIPADVTEQLRDYITCVASMYRENSFHNFEHASHVTMSVVKLLSRIVSPSISNTKKESSQDFAYGIASDPITQFAVVFSALIHDMDHPGVPNATLVREQTTLASVYKNRSPAEQNSLDLAVELFMDDRFSKIRPLIYGTESELLRFRAMLVNSVMATDIVDKELKELRNGRWDRAFAKDPEQSADPEIVTSLSSMAESVDRKATIVIEHLIQASDVSHTMQHWHVYRKWNQRFFLECYKAYRVGRADKDPSAGWYKGEIGFFDFYIIPLAKKLADCGVFGKSSSEYLDYAMRNRQEWEHKGQAIVEELKEAAEELAVEEGWDDDDGDSTIDVFS